MVKRALLTIILLLSLPLQALTTLSASVDKNPVLQNEALTLQIIADDAVAADALSFRALERDFTVMLPSVSSNKMDINGQKSQSTIWRVVLQPKTSGDITIPAFTLRGASSEPINLTVLDAAASTPSNTTPELFLEASISNDKLYIQQLSYYQVRIYYNGDLQRGSLSAPKLDGASIAELGQDVDGSELVNGIRYRTFTRRYAIKPQHSVNFTIEPPTFVGDLIDRDNARYNYYARAKRVSQQAQPIDVTISPLPDNFPGDWLIAGLVTLTEEWVPDLDELKQGEPVTRIITISAVDVAENQLPELQQGFPDGIKLYQEQPQAKSAERNGRIVAQKVFTTAVIANKAGELELPEIKLPWWNSQTDELNFATLPARKLKVIGTPASPASAVVPSQPALAPGENSSPSLNPSLITPTASVSPWQWNYLSSVLFSLWLVSLFVLYIQRQLQPLKVTKSQLQNRVAFNSSDLKRACQQGNPQLAKTALLRFGHQQLDTRCQSLSELSKVINSATLTPHFAQLNKVLYSGDKSEWQGEALWQAWQDYIANAGSPSETNTLSTLYPQ